MGTLSQVIWFINAEKVPNDIQMAHHYTAITKTPELMKLRREHRKRLKAESNGKGGDPMT
jgi:hypothetical protein